jgi:hypothetical protein
MFALAETIVGDNGLDTSFYVIANILLPTCYTSLTCLLFSIFYTVIKHLWHS